MSSTVSRPPGNATQPRSVWVPSGLGNVIGRRHEISKFVATGGVGVGASDGIGDWAAMLGVAAAGLLEVTATGVAGDGPHPASSRRLTPAATGLVRILHNIQSCKRKQRVSVIRPDFVVDLRVSDLVGRGGLEPRTSALSARLSAS